MVLGSIPISRNELVLKIIPEFVLKHSLTIHRRGIRARLYRVPFSTEPPPISVRHNASVEDVKATHDITYHNDILQTKPLLHPSALSPVQHTSLQSDPIFHQHRNFL